MRYLHAAAYGEEVAGSTDKVAETPRVIVERGEIGSCDLL